MQKIPELTWKSKSQQNYRLILTHIVPPFTTGISCVVVDVGTRGGKHGNVQTGRRGDRLSTISLLGCSTSVELATGPTDEEEEVLITVFHIMICACCLILLL